MLSAGSVPNIGNACDLSGTRATRSGRRWIATSSALVVLSCLLLQGCGNSDNKVIAEAEPAPPAPASSKGDSAVQRGETVVPRRDNAASRRARSADGEPSHSFADRFAPAGLAVQATLEQSARVAAADRTGT